MEQVLYRKYRSRSLAEIIGQDHITSTLSKALEKGMVAHAYLFTGPKGTGKTSVARILAHEVNGFTYDDNCSHIDIIEIDAASNRRIDEIRDLRDKVHIAPAIGRYKVYIIDEVHMLTKEAFNALLKTLEEPPDHAIFILATTELNKVPETIISRTQRFSFKPIDAQTIVNHLHNIARDESIQLEPAAAQLIAEHARGGFRDAISLLDQVRHSGQDITVSTVHDALGMPAGELIDGIWQSIRRHDPRAPQLLLEMYEKGYYAPMIAKALLDCALKDVDIELARKLLLIPRSVDPQAELMLVVLEAVPASPSEVKTVSSDATPLKSELSAKNRATAKETPTARRSEEKPPKTTPPTQDPPTKTAEQASGNILWAQVLDTLKDEGHAIYGPLRLADTEVEDDVFHIKLQFPFHIKRISEPSNMKVIQDVIKRLHDKDYDIRVSKKTTAEAKPTTKSSDNGHESEPSVDSVAIVKNIFGSAELL